MLRCQSCGATYASELPDGTQYFHACPPLSRGELKAAVDAGTIVLPKGETVDDAHTRRAYERPNKRDENLKGTRGKDAETIKAEGAGAVEIVP